jgi:hypothetical protein
MSAPPRPKLADPRLWQKRRAHYLAVFRRALMLLRERDRLPEDEPNLNRELHFAVVTARREIDPNGRFGAPIFEAQNPPDPDVDTVQAHEFKRPDAQWMHDDPAAPDDRHREKHFAVECKRLGFPTKARWNLNKGYVDRGIQRFRSSEHCYGVHMAEGAMIGYVQSMGLSEVYAEVCQHATAVSTPPLVLAEHGWQPRGVTEFVHRFDRDFPISPFHLIHLWLDIQDIPVRPQTALPTRPRRAARVIR